MTPMKHSVSCILFSPDRKQILLIKRRDIPVWVLPGGGIEPGESPEAAACREAEEETGYKVKIVRKIAEYTPANKLSNFTHLFEVTPLSGAPSIGAETLDIQFFPFDSPPKNLAPPYPYWIADALSGSSEVIRKKVEGTSYWTSLKLLLLHPILVGRFILTLFGIHINKKS